MRAGVRLRSDRHWQTGESLAEDILLGSVTRHVLEESQSDLLISQ
jgi:nucleotide-binding universal stress UspA family protein